MLLPPAPFAEPPTLSCAPAVHAEDIWIHQFTVEQYHELMSLGVFCSGDPIELLEGLLVRKFRKSPRHSLTTTLVHQELRPLLDNSRHFVTNCAAITTLDSEPEPDVSIETGQPRDYLERHPRPAECGLVIEVADTSLRRDRTLKKRIYARASVPIYWIVNLIDDQIEVYSDPTGPADAPDYRHTEIFDRTGSVPVILAGRVVGSIATSQILP